MSARMKGFIAVAVLLVTAAPAAAAGQPVSGPGFATQFPAGWQNAKSSSGGITTFVLSTPGTTIDEVSIPSAGGIAVTIGTMSTRTFRRQFHRSAPTRPIALARLLIGYPRAARNVKSKGLHSTRLGHRRAARAGFTYTYQGRAIVQRDVVARHGNRLYWIELDVDQANVGAGEAARRTVVGGWRWR
jgi:hypothetical protein